MREDPGAVAFVGFADVEDQQLGALGDAGTQALGRDLVLAVVVVLVEGREHRRGRLHGAWLLEHVLEGTRLVERTQLVVAADRLAVDEDVRRGLAPGLAADRTAQVVVVAVVDLREVDVPLVDQVDRGAAVGAAALEVDLDRGLDRRRRGGALGLDDAAVDAVLVQLVLVGLPHRLLGLRTVPRRRDRPALDAVEADPAAHAVEAGRGHPHGRPLRLPAPLHHDVQRPHRQAFNQGPDHGSRVPAFASAVKPARPRAGATRECEPSDSNRHTLRYWNLNPARLPISPGSLERRRYHAAVRVDTLFSMRWLVGLCAWSWPAAARGRPPSRPADAQATGRPRPGTRAVASPAASKPAATKVETLAQVREDVAAGAAEAARSLAGGGRGAARARRRARAWTAARACASCRERVFFACKYAVRPHADKIADVRGGDRRLRGRRWRPS